MKTEPYLLVFEKKNIFNFWLFLVNFQFIIQVGSILNSSRNELININSEQKDLNMNSKLGENELIFFK